MTDTNISPACISSASSNHGDDALLHNILLRLYAAACDSTQNSSLSCTGLGLGEVPGNPTFFASMVQVVARGRAQLSHQQQQHIINWVCQGAILMDTEAAADQYREAMIRVTAHCPHLVCNDTGSLIRSGGSTRIGRGATAPRGISGMSLCLGAPPMHVTGGYRRCKSVLTTLASMEHLLERLSKAQVMFLPGNGTVVGNTLCRL